MNNNDNDNIVTPKKLQPNDINITNDDTMLNRERENIVKATIDANSSIDKKKALSVNDEIKIKKLHPIIRFLLILFFLTVAVFIAFICFLATKKFIDAGEETTTTREVAQENKLIKYLNKDAVRKFEANTSYNYKDKNYEQFILLLTPKGYDLYNNKDVFILIMGNEVEMSSYVGTYTILGNVIDLTTENDTISLEIKDETLVCESLGIMPKISDTEMKYYTYKDENQAKILLINATLKKELAIYIESNLQEKNIIKGPFTESAETIILNDNIHFVKEGMNIMHDDILLTLAV